ncbi:MAG: hypothetical protein AAF480_00385 [Actinomycetota bacterium]
MRIPALLLALVIVAAGCGGDDEPDVVVAQPTATSTAVPGPTVAEQSATASPEPQAEEPADDELFPDVLAAEASLDGDGTWTFRATLSSPYDSPERYADAWRVLDEEGNELGVRILAHDHANEQPFTRSLDNVEIPDDITVVTVEGRDQISGWGGATVEVVLER